MDKNTTSNEIVAAKTGNGQNFTQNQLTYNTKYTHNATIKVKEYYPYKIP